MSADDSLPDDVETLKRLVRARSAELAQARAEASSAEALIAHLRLAIEKLRRELYGQRSERKARLLEQMELQLEELETSAAEDAVQLIDPHRSARGFGGADVGQRGRSRAVTFTVPDGWQAYDAATLAPIEGATVSIVGSDPLLLATTAADGTYVIPGLATGTYDVSASAAGYDTAAYQANFGLVGALGYERGFDSIGDWWLEWLTADLLYAVVAGLLIGGRHEDHVAIQRLPRPVQRSALNEVLEDSVHAYTRAVLESLAADGLLPELVQVGNEINCGMLWTDTEPGFPALSTCEGHWDAQAAVLNAGIRAVREAAPAARVVIHIAQPENVGGFFSSIVAAGVTDFDVIGVSYYPLWSDVALSDISQRVSAWRATYGKDVMVVETAYPWTLGNADGYGNILGPDALVAGRPATPEGQRDFMIALVREVIDGGGSGVFYWEPGWITSGMRDLWGTGSSWDNATLFDFDGRAHAGFAFYTYPYDLDT